ncbi:DUF1442 domain-containing protein [Ancylobacter sp. MQZ15Z-1]|uniref:DUF1442 domain-containing protein n=1 Tax=Ancylobacter mangrovi TaxID=2972472 RepID=A0A9X2T431_9HYPH|nr:class I SAM-dependent methyltransferase [Ancylobacter mangrovi]MCS0495576.1 DUF1442 domain-containing protein [Ancylobacter mangrovi]
MDDRIEAVLDVYHEMIRREQDERERERRGHAPRPAEGGIDRRLLAVGPQTGRFINLLARSLSAPAILELGTSYGYSGIWLAEAARASGGRLVTMEAKDYKSAFAREMSAKAGLAEHVEFRVGDAVEMISDLPAGLDFVLLDLPNQLYLPALEAFAPKLNPGAIIVADNIRPGRRDVAAYLDAVRGRPDMASLPVPVGNGLEISRFRAFES